MHNMKLTLWIPGSGVADLVIDSATQDEDFITRSPIGEYDLEGVTPGGGYQVAQGAAVYYQYDIQTVLSEEERVILLRLKNRQRANAPGTATGAINFRDELERLDRDEEITGFGSRLVPSTGDPLVDDPVTIAGIATSYFESRGMLVFPPDFITHFGHLDTNYYNAQFTLVEFT